MSYPVRPRAHRARRQAALAKRGQERRELADRTPTRSAADVAHARRLLLEALAEARLQALLAGMVGIVPEVDRVVRLVERR